MHIKHNTRAVTGLPFSELVPGQLYLRIDMPSKRPLVYLAVADRPVAEFAGNLVNMETGCLVGRVSERARFAHLPDAALDTGT